MRDIVSRVQRQEVFCWHLILRMIILKHENRAVTLESDIEAKDKEMYDLKHELISAQIKLENADRAMEKMKEENQELQMKIVQLETEMKITERIRLSKDSLFSK